MAKDEHLARELVRQQIANALRGAAIKHDAETKWLKHDIDQLDKENQTLRGKVAEKDTEIEQYKMQIDQAWEKADDYKRECEGLWAKLEYALRCIPCEEGVFTFPDGESFDAGQDAKHWLGKESPIATQRDKLASVNQELRAKLEWVQGIISLAIDEEITESFAKVRLRQALAVIEGE